MSVQAAALDLSITLTGHEAQDSAGESRGVQRRDRQTPSLPFHQMPGLERGAEDPIGNRTRRLADSDNVQGSGDTHRLQLVLPDRLCSAPCCSQPLRVDQPLAPAAIAPQPVLEGYTPVRGQRRRVFPGRVPEPCSNPKDSLSPPSMCDLNGCVSLPQKLQSHSPAPGLPHPRPRDHGLSHNRIWAPGTGRGEPVNHCCFSGHSTGRRWGIGALRATSHFAVTLFSPLPR